MHEDATTDGTSGSTTDGRFKPGAPKKPVVAKPLVTPTQTPFQMKTESLADDFLASIRKKHPNAKLSPWKGEIKPASTTPIVKRKPETPKGRGGPAEWYGQGRYMGDSVETGDQNVISELSLKTLNAYVKKAQSAVIGEYSKSFKSLKDGNIAHQKKHIAHAKRHLSGIIDAEHRGAKPPVIGDVKPIKEDIYLVDMNEVSGGHDYAVVHYSPPGTKEIKTVKYCVKPTTTEKEVRKMHQKTFLSNVHKVLFEKEELNELSAATMVRYASSAERSTKDRKVGVRKAIAKVLRSPDGKEELLRHGAKYGSRTEAKEYNAMEAPGIQDAIKRMGQRYKQEQAAKQQPKPEPKKVVKEEMQLSELSFEKLDQYKKKAMTSLHTMDVEHKWDQADKRFEKVMRATKKQLKGTPKPLKVQFEETQLAEGRPSQQHPIEGHEYHRKTDDELRYIMKDAGQAAKAMKDHSPHAESKYLDQVNDAASVLWFRKKHGTPPWYQKKYGSVKESFAGTVREAFKDAKIRDAKKKTEKKMSSGGKDKFQADPELSTQITKQDY